MKPQKTDTPLSRAVTLAHSASEHMKAATLALMREAAVPLTSWSDARRHMAAAARALNAAAEELNPANTAAGNKG